MNIKGLLGIIQRRALTGDRDMGAAFDDINIRIILE